MKNFRLFIVDNNGNRIFATKSFANIKQFSKWFAKNIFMFSNKLNFVLGLTPVDIYYGKNDTISIYDKETSELIYKGE